MVVLGGSKRSRKRLLANLAVLALLTLILLQAGCAGVATKTPPPATQTSTPTAAAASAGTPVGHFEVIVTATAGGLVRSTVVTLAVR